MKTIITVTGIRPDFIRMSEIFKKLDKNFNHILIHSGQHYNSLLSDVFFDELEIREPDYNLGIGGPNKEHFHQTGELSVKLIELIREKDLNPDLIVFLGDSNSVVCSVALKKEGYRIGHIEAGMRSGDRRMLEEINRMVCDTCSDFLFVYHDNYKEKLRKENITDGVHVVGNTIVEVVNKHKPDRPKKMDRILLDIHRPENFKYENRLRNIIKYANKMSEDYQIPVHMLAFHRTMKKVEEFGIDLGNIVVKDLMPFKQYINAVYDSRFIISDSGTAQEEPALLGTSVIVPRDYTERPESVETNCSFMIDVNTHNHRSHSSSEAWLLINAEKRDPSWLGDGTTADQIIEILKRDL
jgi:UDP-N-acetylglucosamine 2-epimerase (non-hydrolysing)